MFTNYWDSYDADGDFDSLMPSAGSNQNTFGGNLSVSSAGYDPVWLLQKYGDRLKLLPRDLYDAVLEALRGGTESVFLMQYLSTYGSGALLNSNWVAEASVYLPELGQI